MNTTLKAHGSRGTEQVHPDESLPDGALPEAFPDKALNQELEFLWQGQGESGKTYDLYLGRISRNPVVRSHATGKHFMLPWSRLIELAAQNGIDEPTNTSQATKAERPAKYRGRWYRTIPNF